MKDALDIAKNVTAIIKRVDNLKHEKARLHTALASSGAISVYGVYVEGELKNRILNMIIANKDSELLLLKRKCAELLKEIQTYE